MKNYFLLLSLIYSLTAQNSAVPTPTDLKLSLVKTEKPCIRKTKLDLFLADTENLFTTKAKRQINSAGLKVVEMKTKSKISNRFATTVVTTKLLNTASTSEKDIFSVMLPFDAFLVDFVMEIEGQNYTSYVVKNEEARNQFDSALADGLGAGYVTSSARDSNIFIISINVKPNSKVSLYLKYQELLKRKHGRYENVINVHPGQPVQDLSVEVCIDESNKLKDLKVLPLRTGNEIVNENENLDPKADIKWKSGSSACFKFSPNIERQKYFARLMRTPEDIGLSAQFVVQYDVERDSNGGEMLTNNCFFVNFFAPSGLEIIYKHIVFVLDTSASMDGNKIKQLKEAMLKILDQLHDNDMFNLVQVSNGALVRNLDNSTNNVLYFTGKNIVDIPNAYPANSKYIAAAKKSVNQFIPSGGINALSALDVGLRLIEMGKQKKVDNIDRQSVIVFLSHGALNTNTETIITKITQLNTGLKKSSIFSLSFGEEANSIFLQKLSLMNGGTTKHIYESTDSAKQLEGFYDEISSPVLLNITVDFNPSQVKNVSKTLFPVLYYGSEIVVAGQCRGSKAIHPPVINAMSSTGTVNMRPVVQNSLTDISQLWAYVTVKDLLDKKMMSNSNTNAIDQEIVELSLKYSFVTDLSSMVVTSPDGDVVVGNLELQDTSGTQFHRKAFKPNPNYVRPTSTTTTTTSTTTTTTTTSKPTTPKPITPKLITPKPTTAKPTTPILSKFSNADVKVFSKILINLSLMCLFLSFF